MNEFLFGNQTISGLFRHGELQVSRTVVGYSMDGTRANRAMSIWMDP
jgi:hypothetical protein